EALVLVELYAELGYEQIKLYSSLGPALVAPIARAVHDRDMRLSGHIPAGMLAADAVRAGYDEIQHMNMLLLQSLPDVKDTQSTARFTAIGARAGAIDIDGDEVQNFIALLGERRTVVHPTLAIFEDMFVAR